MTPAGAEKAGAFQMRSLRPVSARIVSYGRENQSRRRPTLYVLRVSRSGAADWYVAKRYSEFRALHDALQRQFSGSGSGRHPSCAACEELESFYDRVRFPERHVLQSNLGFSKKRLDATRMEELDSYVRFLLETTQGLLGDEDDDEEEDAPESDANDCARCLPLDLIREFLMVNEDRGAAGATAPAAPRRQLRRLTRRSSSVTSFHVRELDLVSAEKKSSPTGDSMRNLFAEDWWDPSFADVFDECAAPPEDAFIHRQVEDAPTRTHPLRLIESFPRR
ncbi:Phox homologous domain [Phytophthora cinnamomi]|uniref:Phox homologous domain n=1 Tax=Phytophthora cinnamomi TaxID=4785 RepID=UPI00355ACAF1|nr:Phox homologous domain [Phytophthora cinnamomi]